MLINADSPKSFSNNVKKQDNFAGSMNNNCAERSKKAKLSSDWSFSISVIMTSLKENVLIKAVYKFHQFYKYFPDTVRTVSPQSGENEIVPSTTAQFLPFSKHFCAFLRKYTC